MKYVWLESGDAVHQIDEASSAFFVNVYATKSGVLKFWKGLGDVEFITKRPTLMQAVWHKSNGENVLRVAHRYIVNK